MAFATPAGGQGRAVPLDTFGADNDYGDTTVPLTGAIGHDQPMNTNLVRRVPDQHGNLQTQPGRIRRDRGDPHRPTRPPACQQAGHPADRRDLILTGEELPVTGDIDRAERHAIRITVTDETGRLLQARQPKATAGHAETRFTDLPPCTHTITVTGLTQASPINPVMATTLVWHSTSQGPGKVAATVSIS